MWNSSRLSPTIICLLAGIALVPPLSTQAQDQGLAQAPRAAVFMMDNRGSTMEGPELVGLTNYLATRLEDSGLVQNVPREDIHARMGADGKSFTDCLDQSCQLEIGRVLNARYTISSTVSMVGPQCLIAAAIYDLQKATILHTAVATKDCNPDALIDAVDEVAEVLQQKIAEAIAQEAPAAAAQPAPAEPPAVAQPTAAATPPATVQPPAPIRPPTAAGPSPRMSEPPPASAQPPDQGPQSSDWAPTDPNREPTEPVASAEVVHKDHVVTLSPTGLLILSPLLTYQVAFHDIVSGAFGFMYSPRTLLCIDDGTGSNECGFKKVHNLGAQLALRFWPHRRANNGWFVGGYIQVAKSYSKEANLLDVSFVHLGVDFGYRWIWDFGLTISVGGGTGWAWVIDDEPCPAFAICETQGNGPKAKIIADVGWGF